MEFELEAKVVLVLNHKLGESTSEHVSTDFNLILKDKMIELHFMDNGLPNADGVKALTNCFVQGLIGNIHYGHEKGFRNEAEHLRYIISELEKCFACHKKSFESTFKS